MHFRLSHILVYSCVLVLFIITIWNLLSPRLIRATYTLQSSIRPNLHHELIVHHIPRKIPQFSIFQGFNNETGTSDGSYIVPNIIHYVRFGSNNFSFVEAVCVLSAFKNHRPDMFIFHTNSKKFVGPYWKKIKQTSGFIYKILPTEVPKTIAGHEISRQFRLLHATEFTKIKILMLFGGIVLDNDIYVVKNLDRFRRFEMVLGWDDGFCMSTRVLIANRKARFLKEWFHSYKDYFPRKWYYNAGCKPTWEILHKRPELVHRVRVMFGLRPLARNLYRSLYWHGWKEFYTIPVLVRHASLHQPSFKWIPKFDAENIKFYPMPFGEMARAIYTQ